MFAYLTFLTLRTKSIRQPNTLCILCKTSLVPRVAYITFLILHSTGGLLFIAYTPGGVGVGVGEGLAKSTYKCIQEATKGREGVTRDLPIQKGAWAEKV